MRKKLIRKSRQTLLTAAPLSAIIFFKSAFATLRVCLALSLSLVMVAAQAQSPEQTYPNKPIRLIIPFAAGGASDILARIIGKKLTENWGQPVIVENKVGGNAQIGASYVAKSEPDGYTLLVVDLSAITMAPTLMKNLTYDPAKELTPVAILAYSPHILVVANKLPVKNLAELIAYARSQPVALNFGTPLGAAPHLAGVLLAQKENLQLNFIGYKGGAQVIADLAGGQIDLTMNSFLATYPMAKTGNYRLIAVASPERFAPIPETPTIAERIPGYVTGSFQGMMAPSATPPAIIAKLNAEIAKIAALPEISKQFADLGSEALPRSAADLRKWLTDETAYWARVIETGNVKIE
jgi:tripartite-type tricarboxylate transporter receptor subunit TctC